MLYHSCTDSSFVICVIIIVLFQLLLPNDVKCAYQNLYNPDYLDELEQESQDKTSDEDFLTPSIYIHPDDGGFHNGEKDLLEKRHLGAVTALKDRFQFQRQPMMTSEMLKRHLGSIVSLKKQNLSQMEKRYLGSVAPKSGFRPLSKLTQSERFTSKRHVGAMAKINSKPFKRDGGEGMWDTGSRGIVWNSGESSGETFDEYPVDADLGNADGFQDNPVTIKTKRFLGKNEGMGNCATFDTNVALQLQFLYGLNFLSPGIFSFFLGYPLCFSVNISYDAFT